MISDKLDDKIFDKLSDYIFDHDDGERSFDSFDVGEIDDLMEVITDDLLIKIKTDKDQDDLRKCIEDNLHIILD